MVIILVIALIFLILNSSKLSSDASNLDSFEEDITKPGNDYDSNITYVSDTNNVFVIIAKFLDKIVTFIVEGTFNIIGKGFELIFGI